VLTREVGEGVEVAGTLDVAVDDVAAAGLLAAIADPNRLAVLRVVSAGTVCVCELQERVPIAANLLSYHLRVLREAGLIVGTRRGRWIDYTLADGALQRLHAAIPGSVPPVARGAGGGRS